MNAIGLAITFTFPVLTKRGTIVGMISVSNRWQSGHWRSMYSIIVTGALGLPSTFPCCGMPLNILTAEPESGSVPPLVVGDGEDDEPPVSAKASAAATAASAMTAAPAASTFGEARPPPGLRAGGGGGGVRRCLRAFFPLVISAPR